MARGDELMKRPCLVDRLTLLPDVIRLLILSFLPRKYAIRTGTLSSQWRDLWKSRYPYCTTLDFNESFSEDKTPGEVFRIINDAMEQQGDSKIEVFNLFFYPGRNYQDVVTRWIEKAVLNGVEESDLDFSQGQTSRRCPGRLGGRRKKFDLRESSFTKNILSVLCLRYCTLNRCFSFRHFNLLEVLYLQGINLNDSMLQKLIWNCKALKRLDLRECLSLQYIRISAPHLLLRSLVFVCCWNIQLIELSAQFLQSFHFIGGSPSLYLLNTPRSLVDVVMISGADEYFKRPRDWLNIILGINGVEVMTLCNKGLEFFFGNGGFTSCRLPRLRELQLIIAESGDDHINDICAFLRKCFLPGLERLFIELPSSYVSNWHQNNMVLSQSGALEPQFEKLKLVKLSGFKKHCKEMQLLRFLFEKAVSLEQMVLVVPHVHEIDICTGYAYHLLSMEEVSAMPKASPQAQILWVCSSGDHANLLPTHSSLPFKIIDH